MKKYNIEGGKDFFAELHKSLDVDECEDDQNKCLITNQPLIDKYVTLNCGHKFNYIPLFNDLVNHKKKFNQMEGQLSKLNTNEIRCPYCRKKQQGTLIYYEELGLAKINGVNFYDPYCKEQSNKKNNLYTTYTTHKCEYAHPNPNYNPSEEESIINTPYLINQTCKLPGTQITLFNSLNPSEPITYGDTKHYCYTHKKLMIKQYKIEEKEKEKESKKKAKELEKQKKLLEKQEAKIKAKEEKLKAKEAAKALKINLMSENVVLGPSTVQIGCVQILKTGPNKGKQCGCKIFSENMCKRHMTKN